MEKTIENFINENKTEIKNFIEKSYNLKVDDDDIENFILNDEGLYNWAISESVDI